MIEITLKIDGMMCGMCETHINDVIRRNFNIKKVTTSHTKGECVIISENEIDDAKLAENLKSFVEVILKAKPQTVKGNYVKNISISSTMGPGIKIDVNSFN